MRLIYGTGNDAKLASMRRTVQGLPFEITGLCQAAAEKRIILPEVEENGVTPLENARLKAEAYYQVFREPVFSCDSGLYLWNHETGEMLPEDVQPGLHVRGRGQERYSDDELIEHYTGLVRRYGAVRARYKNGICLIIDDRNRRECDAETLWGKPFLLAGKPHRRRVQGFPLDSISLEIESGLYFYEIMNASKSESTSAHDTKNEAQDALAADAGFRRFFEETAKLLELW